MAHFAKLDENNIVTTVVVVENASLRDVNGEEVEQVGIDFLRNLYDDQDAVWVQTSYNHNFRNKFAGIGYTYNAEDDAFYPPQDYPSWVWNSEIKVWESPIGLPPEDSGYEWNETDQQWELI